MQDKILSAYTAYVLNHGKRPESIYSFAQDLEISESEFYQHYASFDAIDQSFLTTLFHKTVELIEKNEDYASFDGKDKLLTLYYTLFEMLTANRSFVMALMGKSHNPMKHMRNLHPLRAAFKKYVHALNLDIVDLKIEGLKKYQDKGVGELAWAQFMFILKFWMTDTSKGFEKTDVLIEKSVQTGFSLVNSEPVNNLIDLGKFLWKEKSIM